MWFNGLLDLSVTQLILVTLGMTHVTIVSVTLYLHRHSAHNALDLHPVLQHVFRFWLWLTTAQNTKAWTAIHRKHHAKCETGEDPHSPVVLGLRTVLLEGAELYARAATPETLERYGQRTPDDWIERRLYTPYKSLGIVLMAVIDLLLFGVNGIWIWAIQMLWIPVWAAGVINGIGHSLGYRNFECLDNARNILPWGILVGGEELHNNHHTYPNSAKLSRRWYEVDIGWAYIRLFQLFGLARPKGVRPIAHRIPGKQELDTDTVMAIANNRFDIMRQYRKRVIEPALRQQKARLDGELRARYRRLRKLLAREVTLLPARERAHLDQVLAQNAMLRQVYDKSHELQRLWRQRGLKPQEKLQALLDWCREAEASGIRYLAEFAEHLRAYSLRPAG
ncbi:fatty acid desaturase [Marinobacter lutaoensis]|jgi:fatty-acid desaturase|uniref:DesA family fatty acid desaturase n=1 Tax=Marinobacter lutaoensis TaxID=135739 RepID=UPI000C0AB34C|nr:fatty acid desaturase [Marinobacter lutaoensis]MBE02302.1 acyl-CoA desaturase [Marinobacter sp.]MBI43810.1 acyl-CoA desaturase [Oceanospirillales bacterium]NVD35668.1 fatty acid desaturase [Marinobacter lutaoensis]|tara:strand:- start:14 stop:1192 length:1179 start_codon:yes stop_codon:yes gene_type:complete